jgi:hypothetical protein
MRPRYSRILLATLWLLVGAMSAPAEGAWVLWEESGDLQTFQHTAAPHPQASYTNVEDCIKAIDAQWPKAWGTTEGPERHGFSRLTPTSAVVMVRYENTNTTYIVTYTCLPDSMTMRNRRTGETAKCGPPPYLQRDCVLDFQRRGWELVPY